MLGFRIFELSSELKEFRKNGLLIRLSPQPFSYFLAQPSGSPGQNEFSHDQAERSTEERFPRSCC